MTDLDNDFGMRCPECRASDQIDIAATVWVRLCRDGTDVMAADNGDHEWDDDSGAQCCACGHAGTVSDFDISQTQPFIEYWDAVDAAMVKLFGVDTMEIGISAGQVAEAQEAGLTPEEAALAIATPEGLKEGTP